MATVPSISLPSGSVAVRNWPPLEPSRSGRIVNVIGMPGVSVFDVQPCRSRPAGRLFISMVHVAGSSFAVDYVQNDPGSGIAPLELLHGAGQRYGLFGIESGEVLLFGDQSFVACSRLKKVGK
jgi:hypothetical protein